MRRRGATVRCREISFGGVPVEPFNRDAVSERLLGAVEQLPPAELDRFVGAVLAIRARQAAGARSVGESALFERINDAIPAEASMRLAVLREHRDDEALTENERRELVDLEDQREILGARRMDALAHLAALRGTTLENVYRQLEIAPISCGPGDIDG